MFGQTRLSQSLMVKAIVGVFLLTPLIFLTNTTYAICSGPVAGEEKVRPSKFETVVQLSRLKPLSASCDAWGSAGCEWQVRVGIGSSAEEASRYLTPRDLKIAAEPYRQVFERKSSFVVRPDAVAPWPVSFWQWDKGGRIYVAIQLREMDRFDAHETVINQVVIVGRERVFDAPDARDCKGRWRAAVIPVDGTSAGATDNARLLFEVIARPTP